MLTISNRLREISKLIDMSRHTATNGDFDHSNNLYQKAYILSKNILETTDPAMFSDDEYLFLTKIIETFEN